MHMLTYYFDFSSNLMLGDVLAIIVLDALLLIARNLCIKLMDHTHAPNADEVIAAQFKSKIIERATTSHDPPRRIIHEALLNVDKEDATALPGYTASQRTIGCRHKANDIPLSSPTSFQDIIIPQELKLTNSGDRILIYDNENVNSRMIVFSSNSDFSCLSSSQLWHADGTFKVSKHKCLVL